MPPKQSPLLYPALIAIQILFGINFVAMKSVVTVVPPLLWAAIRVLIAAVIMVRAGVALKIKRPPMNLSFFGPAILFSFLAIVVAQGSVSVGLKLTTATNSAILNTLIPIMTLLLVTLRGQEALSKTRALGFGVAFVGILILRRIEQIQFSDVTLIGDLLILLSCLSTAMFLSFGKSLPKLTIASGQRHGSLFSAVLACHLFQFQARLVFNGPHSRQHSWERCSL